MGKCEVTKTECHRVPIKNESQLIKTSDCHTAVISKARKPKIMVAAITAGAIAISTSAIIVPVVAVSLKCGAGDTINLLLKAVHLYYLLGAIIFFAILFVTTKCRFAGQT